MESVLYKSEDFDDFLKRIIKEAECTVCGDDEDLMTGFTEHKMCKKCTDKKHKLLTQ